MEYTSGDIVAIITVAGAVLTGLIGSILYGTSLSRCKEITCCCVHCIREVLTDESLYKRDPGDIEAATEN